MKVVSISCARTHGRQPAVYGSQSSSLSDMFGGIVRCVFFPFGVLPAGKRDTQHSAGVKSSMEHVELVAFDLSQH